MQINRTSVLSLILFYYVKVLEYSDILTAVVRLTIVRAVSIRCWNIVTVLRLTTVRTVLS